MGQTRKMIDVDTFSETHFLRAARLLRDTVPGFDRYPFNLPAVSALDRIVFHPAVTFLIGENGSGKSTLLEAIAVGLGMNAEGGSRNFRFSTRESHSILCDFIELEKTICRPKDSWFLRAESFFNVATEMEKLDAIPSKSPKLVHSYGGRPLHEQSHGESFFALFANRFGDKGLYLLDEPEAALSPMKQFAFLSRLNDLVVGGSQFIIATHSPIILAYPQATIYSLGGKEIAEMKYKETAHYKLTRDFLNHPDRMLPILMDQSSSDDDQPGLFPH